jgi:hypothetical protein
MHDNAARFSSLFLTAVHQLKLILTGKANVNGYRDQKKPDQSENSLLKMIENQILLRLV